MTHSDPGDPSEADVLIRPMLGEDIPAAEQLTARAFLDVDRRALPRDAPEPSRRDPQRARMWAERTAHFLDTDPRGCWVLERRGDVLGVAVSLRRELCWILATYAVRPDAQGRGLGKALLEAALGHSRGCLRGILAASDDPRAYRRYRLAGFHLHPQLLLRGSVDRAQIPRVRHVRAGVEADFDLMDSVDRRCRDCAHGPDHPVLATMYRPIVVDHTTGQGYAYVDEAGRPAIVAATNRRTATRLLWEALASSAPGSTIEVGHVTASNEWAVDVGLAAGLSVSTSGYLAVRGMKPPAPYLPHGSFL